MAARVRAAPDHERARSLADFETSGVAHRYASALFDLARDDDALEAVEANVATLRALLDESADLRRLVASPVFAAEEQIKGLSAVMEKAGVTGLVANFIKLVAKNRRLFALPGMLKTFDALLASHRGETIAIVTSAEPLTEEQQKALVGVLAEKAGGTVKLETHVDASLIGGLIVRLGSQMIDTSVRTRLAALRNAMKEAA
ncbi:F0F1 ATP synthase subunit delta [Acuticoccus sp. 2012]|uniref:ATP synthase subunit delta n=1 Tax=Acuticoccus mangrovi TaxID=2796142 RepID=A0A934IN60_9HYPH|nr:F0F1 ATP synthase subunit delta [Acuticoccus mangrovi]